MKKFTLKQLTKKLSVAKTSLKNCPEFLKPNYKRLIEDIEAEIKKR